MKVDIFDKQNKKISEAELPKFIFEEAWRPSLVRQALIAHLNNSRKSIAHTKDRSEVRGGGRKPWKQKHTGRARHGSIRSPLWVGGGITFGPRNDKKFEQKLNKKMKQKALFSLLAKKLVLGQIKVLDNFNMLDHKTKNLVAVLKNFGDKRNSILIIPESGNQNIGRASQNIEKVKAVSPKNLNIYDCLKYKNILIDKTAINEMADHYKRVR
mgnify:CR=1 FL=1